MTMDNVRSVTAQDLVDEVRALLDKGHRLVTLSCVEPEPGRLEILYHFDLDLALCHLRLDLGQGGRQAPSVTPACPAAFVAENEVQDMFGVAFTGLSPDLGGRLYLDPEAPKAPMLSTVHIPVASGCAPKASADKAPAESGPESQTGRASAKSESESPTGRASSESEPKPSMATNPTQAAPTSSPVQAPAESGPQSSPTSAQASPSKDAPQSSSKAAPASSKEDDHG